MQIQKLKAIDKLGELEDNLKKIKEMSESINNILSNKEVIDKLDIMAQAELKHIFNYNDIINEYYFKVCENIEELESIIKEDIIK